jgi:hypothetical protein
VAQKHLIRSSLLLASMLAALSLTACGGDDDDNNSSTSSSSVSSSKSSSSASSTSSSAASSSSSTSSTSSSTSSSSSSTASHTTVTTTAWSETFDAPDIDTFYSTAYATLPGDTTKPLYVLGGGTLTTGSGTFVLSNGRLLIGATASTASTATTAPDGAFNFSGKTCTLVINAAAVTGSVFQVYVNNSTSTAANSPLGSASRVYNQALAVGDNTISFSIDASAVNAAKAFIQLRADSSTSITINSASMTCQ